MRPKWELRRAGYTTLLVLLGILLFDNLSNLFSADNDVQNPITGYFFSSSDHLRGSFSYEDHSCPADNEEDEDDDENSFESFISKSFQEFDPTASFAFHQDRLFCDPLSELVSPPPKA